MGVLRGSAFSYGRGTPLLSLGGASVLPCRFLCLFSLRFLMGEVPLYYPWVEPLFYLDGFCAIVLWALVCITTLVAPCVTSKVQDVWLIDFSGGGDVEFIDINWEEDVSLFDISESGLFASR